MYSNDTENGHGGAGVSFPSLALFFFIVMTIYIRFNYSDVTGIERKGAGVSFLIWRNFIFIYFAGATCNCWQNT